MKAKKMLLILCIVAIWCSTVMIASASSQKIKVFINNTNLGEIGQLVDGSTLIPIRKVGEAFNSIIDWNASNNTAKLYKPNVHMFVYNNVNNNDSTFGEVIKGSSGKIKVFAQADSIEFKLKDVKFTIVDPSGKETDFKKIEIKDERDNYWFVTEYITYRFSSAGKYTIRCYMKTDFSDDWVQVSEKTITSS